MAKVKGVFATESHTESQSQSHKQDKNYMSPNSIPGA